MTDFKILGLDETTPQIVSPTDNDRALLKPGSLLSAVPDGAGAEAWSLDTSDDYVTAGSKLLSLKNNGVEKFSIDKDGVLSPNAIPFVPAIEIVINSVDDFAVQDATTITLEAFRTYIPGAPIITDKRFIIQPGVSVIGTNLAGHIWEYTESGSMFTGQDTIIFNMQNFGLRCENALAFDFSQSSPFAQTGLNFRDILIIDLAGGIGADKLARFEDVNSVIMNNVAGVNINDGISFDGTNAAVVVLRDIFTFPSDNAFTGINFNSVEVQDFLSISDFQVAGTNLAMTGISGLVDSGNVAIGIVGKLERCEFTGITPVVGVSESDIRWEITDSFPIPDSTKTADTFLTTGRIVPISSGDVNEFVPVAGPDWSSDVMERLSATIEGLLRYLSAISTKALITATATLEKDGGGGAKIQLGIAINNVVITKTIGATENNTPTSVTSSGLFTLNFDDTIQVFVSIDEETDIDVSRCSLTVINGF